jgi:hypothetical protein
MLHQRRVMSPCGEDEPSFNVKKWQASLAFHGNNSTEFKCNQHEAAQPSKGSCLNNECQVNKPFNTTMYKHLI